MTKSCVWWLLFEAGRSPTLMSGKWGVWARRGEARRGGAAWRGVGHAGRAWR